MIDSSSFNKMEAILMFVPSRKRANILEKLRTSFNKTSSGYAELLVILDRDDSHNYYKHHDIKYEIYDGEIGYAQEKMNHFAVNYAKKYRYVGFIGDDNEFITQNWDEIAYNRLSSGGENSIGYLNDLMSEQGRAQEKACRNVIMDSNIITKLDFMAPKCLRHFYNDNFWYNLGASLRTLVYFNNVKVNHNHYLNSRSEYDEVYEIAYSDNKMQEDSLRYSNYMMLDFEADLSKLK